MPTSATDSGERPPIALDVDTVVAGYGGPPIIRGVCAQVGTGEIVTVVGPNGAGKSTMLKAVAGLLRIQSGSVTLDGKQIANGRTHQLARSGLGYVPQNNDVFDPLTGAFHRFVTGSDAGGKLNAINSPWGVALAPGTFGSHAGQLLVGNFGSGTIMAFDANGRFRGFLEGINGEAVVIEDRSAHRASPRL